MTELQIVLSVLCGLAALLVVVQVVRDRQPNKAILGLLLLIEVGLVANLVLGLRWVTGEHADISAVTYLGYLVGLLLILPLAWGWSWAERSRSGTSVILVGLVVVPYLFVRLHQVANPIS